MHVWMHACMYACTHVRTCVRTYIRTYVRMYACMHVCMCAYMYICTYERTHTPMYISTYVRISIRMHGLDSALQKSKSERTFSLSHSIRSRRLSLAALSAPVQASQTQSNPYCARIILHRTRAGCIRSQYCVHSSSPSLMSRFAYTRPYGAAHACDTLGRHE